MWVACKTGFFPGTRVDAGLMHLPDDITIAYCAMTDNCRDTRRQEKGDDPASCLGPARFKRMPRLVVGDVVAVRLTKPDDLACPSPVGRSIA